MHLATPAPLQSTLVAVSDTPRLDEILDRLRGGLRELMPDAKPTEIEGALVRLLMYVRREKGLSELPLPPHNHKHDDD